MFNWLSIVAGVVFQRIIKHSSIWKCVINWCSILSDVANKYTLQHILKLSKYWIYITLNKQSILVYVVAHSRRVCHGMPLTNETIRIRGLICKRRNTILMLNGVHIASLGYLHVRAYMVYHRSSFLIGVLQFHVVCMCLFCKSLHIVDTVFMILRKRSPKPGLACTYFFTFFGRIPKYGFGHETDSQKCYGRKNTGKFGVSAIRNQWTTSRTRIRPKSMKKKLKLYFAYPSKTGKVFT